MNLMGRYVLSLCVVVLISIFSFSSDASGQPLDFFLLQRPSVTFGGTADFPVQDTISAFQSVVQCNPAGGGTPPANRPAADCTYFELGRIFNKDPGTTLYNFFFCSRYAASPYHEFGIVDDGNTFRPIIPANTEPGGTFSFEQNQGEGFRFAFRGPEDPVNAPAGPLYVGSTIDVDNIGQIPHIIVQRATNSGFVHLAHRSPDLSGFPPGIAKPIGAPIDCPVEIGDLILFAEDALPSGVPGHPVTFPSDNDFDDFVIILRQTKILPKIEPMVNCVARSGPDDYTVHWGYWNTDPGNPILLPPSFIPGQANYFTPDPPFRSQPSWFLPGLNQLVFSESFHPVASGSTSLTWNLTFNSATATNRFSERCKAVCAVDVRADFSQCEKQKQIRSVSTTQNNSGQLQYEWSTTCPATIQDANTANPTLVLNDSAFPVTSTQTCKATLKITDDTSYGGPSEVSTDTCETLVTFPACRFDCAGTPFGNAEPDECGVCNGDNSTCLDCAGIPKGGTVVDQCNVCGGNNSTCVDCRGIPNGGTIVDNCGICGGDGSKCNSTLCPSANIDLCGVCNGDNKTCVDCAGIPNGNTKVDSCGVCNGDESTCHQSYCERKPAPLRKTINKLKKEFRDLYRRADRYTREAAQCLRTNTPRLKTQRRDLQKALNTSDRFTTQGLGASSLVCPESECITISSNETERSLQRLAKKLLTTSTNARKLISRCREPLRSGPPVREARDIYNSILRLLRTVPEEQVICEGSNTVTFSSLSPINRLIRAFNR